MRSICLSVVAGAILIGTPAVAQRVLPEPKRIDRQDWARKFEQEYGARMLVGKVAVLKKPGQVASCLVNSPQGSAGRLVGGPMTNDARYQALMTALQTTHKQCAPSAAIPLAYISAALAEEILRKERPKLQDRATPDVAAKAFYTSSSGGLTIDSVARCLAAHAPGLAYRVVATPAGSAGEGQALAALYAQTPECAVSSPPPGISAAEQRSAVAAGLYHWVHRG